MNKNFIVGEVSKKIDYSKEDKDVIKAIEETRLEMEVTRSAFQFVNDDKLIESIIFREHDVMSRYEYLIQEAKRRGLKVSYDYIFKNCCNYIEE